MNILLISVRADFGGGPEHILQLIAHSTPEVRYVVACPNDEPYYARFVDLLGHENVILIPHRRLSAAAFVTLIRAVKHRHIDVVHSHGKGAGVYGRIVAAMTLRPCVHTFHGLHVGDYNAAARSVYLWLERVLGWLTAAAICVSQGEHEQILAARGAPASRLRVIANGVVLSSIRNSEPDDSVFRLVAVSRYDVQKNPELMVQIGAGLATDSEVGPFELTVLGQGEYLEVWRTRIVELGLQEHIRLIGPTTEPRALFRKAHVFLSTSRWEGMPLAVLEAMSEGLPVVATDVVGNRDVVIHGVNGLLYSSDDAAGAVMAVKQLADKEYRRHLGACGRRTVEQHYSARYMAERTCSVYKSVLPA